MFSTSVPPRRSANSQPVTVPTIVVLALPPNMRPDSGSFAQGCLPNGRPRVLQADGLAGTRGRDLGVPQGTWAGGYPGLIAAVLGSLPDSEHETLGGDC